MKIVKLKTNHMVNPLGFDLGKPHLSYVVSDTNAKRQTGARILVSADPGFEEIVFDTGISASINSLDTEIPIQLKPCTRYYWKVQVWTETGESTESTVAWFETAKMDQPWTGIFITPDMDKDIHPVFMKNVEVRKTVYSARMYICGLGLYEIEINGKKVGDEYLAPYCNAYDKWIQYQTYDISNYLQEGDNSFEIPLGNGWYKGYFGYGPDSKEVYGDKFALLCEVVINYTDGTTDVINSDTSWKVKRSKIIESSIYHGEIYDANMKDETIYSVNKIDLDYSKLKARLSLPVVIKHKIKPIEIITTPKGETVLDMGQNMVGWVSFKCKEEKGTEIVLQHGEILQEGNFYRDNLRAAKAEYHYISDGKETVVRPHFTFYGFRFVKVTGIKNPINLEDFTGNVLYSDMEQTGFIETSDPLVNQLFSNTLWGQRGNFLDVPTDCPQRNERLGWTGDAQMFSGTACYNMDVFEFLKKYSYDLYQEQKARDGLVPMFVPALNEEHLASTAWGEAATVIPWVSYVHYGNKSIIEDQFDSMKAWVDFMRREDEKTGGTRLWKTGFHFGDWLALDGGYDNMPTGGTDIYFISSAYYFYSTSIVAKAAKVLGKTEITNEYEQLAGDIKNAIQDEYFTKNGRLAIDTQTARVVALFMNLVPDEYRSRIAEELRERLKKDKNYLRTGFVGTPYLCRVLSENGCNDLAYTLLLNKEYPGWLYAITMGATTIWERWNSVLPDGKISSTGMNSLNHYTYGSIVEWMYRNAAGINPIEEAPGFKRAKLAPNPDARLQYVKASLDTASGTYKVNWNMTKDNNLEIEFTIPFDCKAAVVLPNANGKAVLLNNTALDDLSFEYEQKGNTVVLELESGTWKFCYTPTTEFIRYYSTKDSIDELYKNEEAKQIINEFIPFIKLLTPDIYVESIRELAINPFFLGVSSFKLTEELMDKLDALLGKIQKK
jgi:alpha-L-rhamnosidase